VRSAVPKFGRKAILIGVSANRVLRNHYNSNIRKNDLQKNFLASRRTAGRQSDEQ
jgi:hypothetical protein